MYLVNGGSQKTSSSHSCDSHAAFSTPSGLAGGRCPKTFEERLPHPVGRGVRNGPARTSKTSAAVREVRSVRGSAAGGADAFEARADTKTGEQEAAEPQAGPTRSEPAPARKQENRKYFTEVPHASCSPVFGMARGGSSCLPSGIMFPT